jgi:hypothetical protein
VDIMKRKVANFLIVLSYYLIVISLLLEVANTSQNGVSLSPTTNNFESGLHFSGDRWTWISTPAPEIVSSQYFEGTHSLKAYEDAMNFNYGGGAQVSCGFNEPKGGTYFQLRMLFDTDFDLHSIDQICFMSVGNKNCASLYLVSDGYGCLSLVLSTTLPYKAQYSYNLTGQLQTNTWYMFALFVDRSSNGNIQAFFGDVKVIDSAFGDNTAMDSTIVNCGWCWGNHAGSIFIDDVQICELGSETNPILNSNLNPISTPTLAPQSVATLTFGPIIGGSVTLGWRGNDTVFAASGSVYTINSGVELTIVAYPDNGMRLGRWRISGETATDNPHSWNVRSDATVNVTFEPAIAPPSPLSMFFIRIIGIAGIAVAVLGVIKRRGRKL